MLNNTYKALRVLGAGYDLFYSVWCNNEHELYDLTVSSLREEVKKLVTTRTKHMNTTR